MSKLFRTYMNFFYSILESYQDELCGRPLGFDFDTISNSLVVADAYYGIWLVDLDTGKKMLLISPDQELEGKTV